MYHFEPEKKRQAVEFCCKRSPALEHFKTTAFVGRGMFTVFWVVKGVVHTGFMPTGTTVNFELYCETLGTLNEFILRRRSLSFNVKMLDNTHISARGAVDSALVSPSWITYHILLTWHYQIFIYLPS